MHIERYPFRRQRVATPIESPRIVKKKSTARPLEATGVVVQGPRFLGPAIHAPQALLPVAIAALALGAGAIGALAIGRLAVGQAVFKSVHIRQLVVDDLTVRRRLDSPDQ